MVKKNMYPVDRVLRIVFAAILIYFGFIDVTWISNMIVPVMLGVIGIINLVFSVIGYCPVYTLANINSRHSE